jgi:CHAT domain-containing protein/tetratricopeptide (TPR) repeat protein
MQRIRITKCSNGRFPLLLVFACVTLGLFFTSGKGSSHEAYTQHELRGDRYMAGQLFQEASDSYADAIKGYLQQKKRENFCRVTNKRIESLWRLEKYQEADSIARSNYFDCLEYLGTDHPETGKTLMHLGIIAILSDVTAMAWEYLDKASRVFEHNYSEAHPTKAKCYEWLGFYHDNMGDTANARICLWKSLNMYQTLYKTGSSEFGDVYRYIALYFRRCGLADSAMLYCLKAKKCFDDYYGPANFQSVKCLNNICALYEEKNMFREAEAYYDTCFKLLESMPGYYRYSLMMTWFNLGECYSKQGKLIPALQCLQQVIALYHPGFKHDNILANPVHCTNANYVIGLALGSKANMLNEYYDKDPATRIDYLKSAAECYRLIDQIAEQDRKRIINFENLLRLEHNSNSGFYTMGQNALKLFDITGDTSYLSNALTYFEKNRSALNLMGNQFLSAMISGSSEESVEEIISLQHKTTVLTGQFANADHGQKDSLQHLLTQTKIDLDMTYYKAYRQNPDLFSNLVHKEKIHISQIINRLKEDQTVMIFIELVHYRQLHLEEAVVIGINKKGILIKKINGKALESSIRQFIHDLQDVSDSKRFMRSGSDLYDLILHPFESQLVGELIIVPSFFSGVVPFDAIPTKHSGDTNFYQPLINDITIWKIPSIKALNNRSLKPVADVKVLSVAPAYSGKMTRMLSQLTNRSEELVELPMAKKECEFISTIFPSEILTGYEATSAALKRQISGATIVHLSTHGVVDSTNQSMIRLAFSGNRNNDAVTDFLDFYDIVNLPVTADLVVLSACKTGVGQINGGIGTLNLAVAFTAAGAKSTVISQWDANDFSSYTIMTNFYQNLKEGMNKPSALRQAKLDYIANADETLSHPFFWAGFEYFGAENSYVSHGLRWNQLIIWAGIVVLLTCLMLAYIFNIHQKLFPLTLSNRRNQNPS